MICIWRFGDWSEREVGLDVWNFGISMVIRVWNRWIWVKRKTKIVSLINNHNSLYICLYFFNIYGVSTDSKFHSKIYVFLKILRLCLEFTIHDYIFAASDTYNFLEIVVPQSQQIYRIITKTQINFCGQGYKWEVSTRIFSQINISL